MSNFTFDMPELENFKKTFNTNRIPADIANGVGKAVKQLHASIEHAVATRYKTSKPLSSVLVGGSISNVVFGKNVIRGGLEYKFVPVGLASFFSPPAELGNINEGAKRPGFVHSVEIIRGQRKVVHGKEHRGGFIPLGWKSPMFERMSKARLPLRTLYAPSLSQMASHVVNTDAGVQFQINNIAEIIGNEIEL